MMTEVGPSRVGLGPFLDGYGTSRRFSHSGANDSYRAWFEAWLADGDGVVIFTNSVGGGPLRAEIRRAVAAAEHWPQSRLSINVPAVTLPPAALAERAGTYVVRSEEHTSELQSLMRISYAVFCLNKKKKQKNK